MNLYSDEIKWLNKRWLHRVRNNLMPPIVDDDYDGGRYGHDNYDPHYVPRKKKKIERVRVRDKQIGWFEVARVLDVPSKLLIKIEKHPLFPPPVDVERDRWSLLEIERFEKQMVEAADMGEVFDWSRS